MAPNNIDWYLGHDRAGITEPIVTVERYRQSGLRSSPAGRDAIIPAVITIVVSSPLVLLGRFGMLGIAGLVFVVDRAVRRVRKMPNDVLVVLTDHHVHLLRAVSTLRTGWVVKGEFASWSLDGSPPPVEVGHFLDLRFRAPGYAEELVLVPALPSQEAAVIAAALGSHEVC